jgi:hypothetical protein
MARRSSLRSLVRFLCGQYVAARASVTDWYQADRGYLVVAMTMSLERWNKSNYGPRRAKVLDPSTLQSVVAA